MNRKSSSDMQPLLNGEEGRRESTMSTGSDKRGGGRPPLAGRGKGGYHGETTDPTHAADDGGAMSLSSRFSAWKTEKMFKLREQWQSIPFSVRILMVPICTLAIAVLLVALTVDYEIEAEHAFLKHYPDLIDRFAVVMENIVHEDVASQDYVNAYAKFGNASSTSYLITLLEARAATDTAMVSAQGFYKAHQDDLPIVVKGTKEDPTVSSELQFEILYELRARILPIPLMNSYTTSTIYADMMSRMGQFMTRLCRAVNSASGTGVAVDLWIAEVMVGHVLDRAADAHHLLEASPNIAASDRAHRIALVLQENFVVRLMEKMLSIFLENSEYLEVHKKLKESTINHVFERLEHDLLLTISLDSNTWTTDADYSILQNTTRRMLDTTLALTNSMRLNHIGIQKSVSTQFGLRVTLGIFSCFLTIALGYCIYDRLTDTESQFELKASHTMREAIARVREYSTSFEHFHLNPPPAPEGMLGTPTGEIEKRLARCLASLRSLAAFLPPLLLDHRSGDTAEAIAKLRQIEKGQLGVQRPERGMIQTSDLEMLSQADVDQRTSADLMIEATELGSEETLGVCLTIDLSQLHQHATGGKASSVFVCKMYPEILAILEEKVINAGGVLASSSMDYATAVWLGPDAVQEYSLVATQTANAIVKELHGLRRKVPQLASVFRVRLGVTAGPLTVGIFGDEEYKTLQCFGSALVLGPTVAQVNKHHATTVLCDEQVRKTIEHTFPCKPIELLLNGDVIYETIQPQRGREDDLEARLSMYNRAFGLFRQKYFREALKAFRGYTKQYGYDRSVERIQSLMTGE